MQYTYYVGVYFSISCTHTNTDTLKLDLESFRLVIRDNALLMALSTPIKDVNITSQLIFVTKIVLPHSMIFTEERKQNFHRLAFKKIEEA